MKVAFIGLGKMGAPMALNLVAAGFEVVGFDPEADAPDGIEMAASAGDAAYDADAVITMVPNGAALRAVAAQIRSVTVRGALHLDCSTVDIESAKAVAELAKVTGMQVVDAPAQGGVKDATEATLSFLAGGTLAAFALAQPFFDAMGRSAVHCGAAGAGQAAAAAK
jgi:3-hydroxyisobutyrate dehydrogenase